MKSVFAFAIVASTLAFTPAMAVEVTGGDLAFSYSTFTDDTDVSKLAVTGAVEIGFTPNFGVQFDAGAHAFNLIDETGTNLTLHGIYHANDQVSFGGFYGNDRLFGDNQDFYGLEAGFDLGAANAEAYLAHADDAGFHVNITGLSGSYGFDHGFTLGGSLQHANFDGGLDVTRFGATGSYAVSPTFDVYAELGTVKAGAFGFSNSEPYVGIGAAMTFGAERGATFGRRGLFELLPGL
ncbi:hypothetical protein OEZ60_00945 [Defluviimonas sp. WL0024]|uniref:Porin domain-containing protein n=1 Tax=Albidovulum salinarum TaxID=2984153 RepID=A0ABT2WY19_9RHOB|nr:porin [Defluviimonas sp. WL0024]MCU9846572.1 hypothetical protein [Defluviimonas sp. WL0024]